MSNNLPTQDELELIAFAAAEKDKHRPMISTADGGSDCPTFERLAEIIAAQAEAIDELETERDLWKSTAKNAKADHDRVLGIAQLKEEEAIAAQLARVSEDQRKILDMSAELREHRTYGGES